MQQRDHGSSWDAELSCASLAGLLEGAAADAWDEPEVLQPQVLPSAASPWSLDSQAAGVASGWAPGKEVWQAQLQLPAVPAASPVPASMERLPACGAPAQAPASPEGWAFQDARTAAAYQQLRHKQAAAARRRELKQQLQDPVTRLHRFQGRGGGSGGFGGGSSSSLDWSLPALPAPVSPRASAGAHAAGLRRTSRASPARASSSTAAVAGPGRQRSGGSGSTVSMPALRLHTVHLDS